jgi:hypothetical protein
MRSTLVTIALLSAASLSAATCDSLVSLKIADTTITSAQTVAAGTFLPPNARADSPAASAYKNLPAFCRVEGFIAPAADSHIGFEVWLPASGWNGKYLGVGNGGFAGAITYSGGIGNAPGLAEALRAGYAGSSTDTGHRASGTDADWALGHPEKIVDFGYRGIHETAAKAKAVIEAFYGTAPRKAYFSSCSNGGRQALMEAQRYPADYDGILGGAPANFSTHQNAANIWVAQALLSDPASYIKPAKLPAIEAAVLAACDARDGVTDGVLDDPRKCGFDPSALLCQGAETDACLTAPQLTALQKIYAGPKNSKGGQIFPGTMPGGSLGAGAWTAWITGTEPAKSLQYAFGVGAVAKIVYQNPAWDFRTFDFDKDVAYLDDKLGPIRNAVNPDLSKLKDRGGKLIIYHGWSDPGISPVNSVNYYTSVVDKMGQKETDSFLRLYMAPGMQHCGGGPGPNVLGAGPNSAAGEFTLFSAMEKWVESGKAPEKIVATKFKTDGNAASGVLRTRPLCAYPQVARYSGSGSTDDAANFSCVAP